MKPFHKTIKTPLKKESISVLQINLGRKCNLSCVHCHVEAGPHKKEEISDEILDDILEIIKKFPQIKTIDLTGGAPELHNGFQEIVIEAHKHKKEIIDRCNLTVFFEKGLENTPDFLRNHKVRIVASLPCYLEQNVDAMRGNGTFQKSIQALILLNNLGYGKNNDLIIDLVYNPAIPKDENFSLPPNEKQLEHDYKDFLKKHFNITFNSLIAITNIPIGRFKKYLQIKNLEEKYLAFLHDNCNLKTLPHLMCKNMLSVDYLGNIYDCDFNQMKNVHAISKNQKLTLQDLRKQNNLDLISTVQTQDYCYGCTAGCGSSCGGTLT